MFFFFPIAYLDLAGGMFWDQDERNVSNDA